MVINFKSFFTHIFFNKGIGKNLFSNFVVYSSIYLSLLSNSSFSQTKSFDDDLKIGFVKSDSLYFFVEDRNNDCIVDKFSLTSYTSKELSSYIYRDSSSSFRKVSETSSVVFSEEFFEDNDFDYTFENNFSIVDGPGGSLEEIHKTHFSGDFIKPYIYFPNGKYVLRNSYLLLGSLSSNKSIGSLLYGTLSVQDNNLDGVVDSYFFQLNYTSGVVQIDLKDRNSDGFFEYSKVFLYDKEMRYLDDGDLPQANNLVDKLKVLSSDAYLISSQGELVEKVR